MKHVRQIVIVGGAHPDRIAHSASRLIPGVSNPGLSIEAIGGAAFNAATALRAFETPVGFVGIRGGDAGAEMVENALAAIGVCDVSAVMLDRATASYTAILDAGGELHVAIADMGIYDSVSPRLLRRGSARRMLRSAQALLLDANLPQETIAALVKSRTVPIAAIGVSPAKVVRLAESAAGIAAIFLSRREAAALTGHDPSSPPADLASLLARQGFVRAIVTDGANSAAVLDGRSVHLQSPPDVDHILDVTGAGDTLAAVTLLAWCEGLEFAKAARLGMAAASLRIQRRLFPGCRGVCETIAAGLPPSVAFFGKETA